MVLWPTVVGDQDHVGHSDSTVSQAKTPILQELKPIVGETATWALTLMSILVLLLWLKLTIIASTIFFCTDAAFYVYSLKSIQSSNQTREPVYIIYLLCWGG